MYGKVGTLVGGAGGTSTLAYTGFDALGWAVAGTTLLFAGLALLKLAPRRSRG
jgi:hypothetical protein